MGLFRRGGGGQRPTIKSAVAKADSAAGKANAMMDTVAADWDDIMETIDDPEQAGEYLWGVVKGVMKAAKADKSGEADGLFTTILKLFSGK